jgi:hypothetical protein
MITFDEMYPDAITGCKTENGKPTCHKRERLGKCIICGADTHWASRRKVFVCGPEHHAKLWNDMIQMFAISNIVS